jgi:hypothetical protein
MPSIPDPNLRLTLLNSLWNANLLPRFDKEAFYRDVLREEWDPEAEYNDGVDERVREHLLSIPLSDDLLAKLMMVVWDGGNEVHHHIWTNWDGEDDTFNVRDLRGIEACTNLEVLEFTGGASFGDCSPLAGLSKLRRVTLFGGWLTNATALLSLPSLKKLECVVHDSADVKATLDELRSRGVSVTAYDG